VNLHPFFQLLHPQAFEFSFISPFLQEGHIPKLSQEELVAPLSILPSKLSISFLILFRILALLNSPEATLSKAFSIAAV